MWIYQVFFYNGLNYLLGALRWRQQKTSYFTQGLLWHQIQPRSLCSKGLLPPWGVGKPKTNDGAHVRLTQRKGMSSFHIKVSPVTPNGFIAVCRMSLLELPGCKIEIFESVSIIRLQISPSITTWIEGVPCCIVTETMGHATAFSGGSRRKELSPFMSLRCFPNSLLPPWTLVYSGTRGFFFPVERECLEP